MAGMDDRVWRTLRAKIDRADKARVHVGVLASQGGNAPVPGGKGLDMVGLATIHEFGAPKANIPERSFIRRTFETKQGEIGALTAKLAKGFVEGKISLHKAMDILGHKGAAMIKATITQGPHIPPPLQPETVARKGSDRPLVDTGRLVDSISHEVVDAGETGRAGYTR